MKTSEYQNKKENQTNVSQILHMCPILSLKHQPRKRCTLHIQTHWLDIMSNQSLVRPVHLNPAVRIYLQLIKLSIYSDDNLCKMFGERGNYIICLVVYINQGLGMVIYFYIWRKKFLMFCYKFQSL